MHIWVKLTNINNMYQSILEIFSKADGTRQIILSHHDVRHTNYGYQETPYISINLSLYHHIHIHIIHPLNHNAVMIKLRMTRNPDYRLGN